MTEEDASEEELREILEDISPEKREAMVKFAEGAKALGIDIEEINENVGTPDYCPNCGEEL